MISIKVSSGHGPPFSNLYKEAVILKSEMILVVYIRFRVAKAHLFALTTFYLGVGIAFPMAVTLTICNRRRAIYESIPFSVQLLNEFWYSKSKPPSKVDEGWIYWSNEDLSKIDQDSISALVVIGKKGSINIIYKPTPVLNSLGKLEAIVGNIHDMKSTQSIFKIEGDEVGSCFAIEKHENVPMNHRPEFPLGADAVKGTCYEDADDELALVALPNIALLPYGFEIKSVELDEDFVEEMKKISDNHGFWAQQMFNAFDQHDKDHGTELVVENLTNLIKNEPARRSKKMASASTSATKNFSTVFHAAAGPIVDISQAQPHPLPDDPGVTQPVLTQMIETLKNIGSSLTSNHPTSIVVASQTQYARKALAPPRVLGKGTLMKNSTCVSDFHT